MADPAGDAKWPNYTLATSGAAPNQTSLDARSLAVQDDGCNLTFQITLTDAAAATMDKDIATVEDLVATNRALYTVRFELGT